MQKPFRSVMLAMAILATVAMTLSASPVDAKTKVVKKKKVPVKTRYVLSYTNIPRMSEKDLANPTSRCVTATTKAMHDKTVAQMNKDIAQYGAGHEKAVADYKANVNLGWGALSEPYCGFGSFGIQPFVRSYEKSITHTRQVFLDAVK